jgi:hypothetical protein
MRCQEWYTIDKGKIKYDPNNPEYHFRCPPDGIRYPVFKITSKEELIFADEEE